MEKERVIERKTTKIVLLFFSHQDQLCENEAGKEGHELKKKRVYILFHPFYKEKRQSSICKETHLYSEHTFIHLIEKYV